MESENVQGTRFTSAAIGMVHVSTLPSAEDRGFVTGIRSSDHLNYITLN